ncbi:unnamed protein product, partial [Brassica oleracea]
AAAGFAAGNCFYPYPLRLPSLPQFIKTHKEEIFLLRFIFSASVVSL